MEMIYVVVPVYKVEPYIHRCIDSILNQTLTDFKLVLVDDGSPDNCPAICDEYAAKDSRIHVIHQENGGLSAARNAGIGYAMEHGDPAKDWISFIDSDDFVHPKYLEYLYRVVKETGTEISSCGYDRTEAVEADTSEIEQMKWEDLSPETYWCRNFTNANVAWGKLYRVRLFETVRYPAGKIYEDNYTTYKIMFQNTKIAVVRTPLYYWYINYESISKSAWSPARIDKLDALEAQLAYFTERGFPDAYRKTVETLFLNTSIHLREVRALSPKYDRFLKKMKQRQHRAIRLYAKHFGWGKALWNLFDIRIRRPLKHAFRNGSLLKAVKRKLNKLLRK